MNDDPSHYCSDTAINSQIEWVRHPTRQAGRESDQRATMRPTDPVELATRFFIVSADDLVEIQALRDAGWTHEFPSGNENAEPYAWRWRRPGPRGGRLFRSTGQAYAAMERGKR